MKKEEKYKCGIYGYQDIKTKKILYIGQTITSFIERDRKHRNSNPQTLCDRKLQKYPNKYKMIPIKSFSIGTVSTDFLNPLEKYFVKKFNTFHNMNPQAWNLTSGGDNFISSNIRNKNISLSQNTTGYRWVSKIKSDRYTQGFYFSYSYYKNGKRKLLRSVDINKLKQMVLENNLPWERLPGEYKKIKPYESNNILPYITKSKCNNCKRGFIFRYYYYDENEGKRKSISSVDLKDLKEKVKNKGLLWENSLEKEYKEIEPYVPLKKNITGYYHVSKIKRNKTRQGFTYRYSYIEDGKKKSIDNVNIEKLEKKVKEKGLLWKKIS